MASIRGVWRTALSILAGLCALAVLTSQSVAAENPQTNPESIIVIAGQTSSIPVNASGFTFCAGQDVTVFLGFPTVTTVGSGPVNPHLESAEEAQRYSSTVVHVDETGAFHTQLAMAEIPLGRWTGFVGMSGKCVVSGGFTTIAEIFQAVTVTSANLDEIQSGLTAESFLAGSSAVVIPSWAINGIAYATKWIPGNKILDHLSVYANGELCRTADLTQPTARDGAGDAIVVFGGPGEPTVCSEEGAVLTFTTSKQDVLVNFQTTLLPGTLQPIQLTPFPTDMTPSRRLIYPAAVVIGGGFLPPSVGSGASGTNIPISWIVEAAVSLLVASFVFGIVLGVTRRR